MATRQTKDVNYRQAAVPFQNGDTRVLRFEFNLAAAALNGLLAADILEIGVLPGGCKVLNASLRTTGLTAGTVTDVGLMTGEYGTPSNARTMNATGEIFEAAAIGDATATPVQLDAIQSVNADRGIGVRVSVNEAAGAKTGVLILTVYASPTLVS